MRKLSIKQDPDLIPPQIGFTGLIVDGDLGLNLPPGGTLLTKKISTLAQYKALLLFNGQNCVF